MIIYILNSLECFHLYRHICAPRRGRGHGGRAVGEMTDVCWLLVLSVTKLNEPHCRIDVYKGMCKNGQMKRTK